MTGDLSEFRRPGQVYATWCETCPYLGGCGNCQGGTSIQAMTPAEMLKVRALEQHLLATQEQIDLEYEHELWAGVYDRTVLVPAGHVITGTPVKIETLLTIVGDVIIGLDGNEQRVTGFAKIRAAAHRMGVFTAITDTYISMSFATDAKTRAEAEAQFTDEAHRLASRRQPCLE